MSQTFGRLYCDDQRDAATGRVGKLRPNIGFAHCTECTWEIGRTFHRPRLRASGSDLVHRTVVADDCIKRRVVRLEEAAGKVGRKRHRLLPSKGGVSEWLRHRACEPGRGQHAQILLADTAETAQTQRRWHNLLQR